MTDLNAGARTVDPNIVAPRSRALWTLALALVLAMSTWFSASAVIPQLRIEWGLSDGQAAWLTIAVQLGFVGGSLLSSVVNLSDLVSPRWVIFGGALGAAAANLLLAAANGPGLAIPLRFVTGFFLAGVYPPAVKLIATWFQRGRGIAVGILIGALTLGSAAPHLVNAFGDDIDWLQVVYVTSALTLLGATIALLVPEGPFPFPRARFDPQQTRRVMSDRAVRLASIGYFGHMWELYAMWAWFVVFFNDAVVDRARAASLAAFATIGIGALGCVIGGVLGDRFGRTRTAMLMMLVSGACALIVGPLASGPLWLVLAISLVWGLSVVGDSAQFSTMVTELADQAYVGTALTLQLAIGFTLTVATIWLLPLAEAEVGWRWAFVLLVPGPLLGIFAMARLRALPEARKIAHGLG